MISPNSPSISTLFLSLYMLSHYLTTTTKLSKESLLANFPFRELGDCCAMLMARNMSCYDVPEGVDIRGRYDEEFAKILTRDALRFVADLQREFRGQIRYAFECRREAKRRYNSGELPGFDPATKFIREGDWVCAPVPPAVEDRTVEITGPVDRKMIINALNSGAKVFMVW